MIQKLNKSKDRSCVRSLGAVRNSTLIPGYMPGGNGKKSKYRNKKCVIDGIKFDSKRESFRYVVLKQMETEGLISDLKLQPRFAFPPGFTYVGDFLYREPDRKDPKKSKIVVEDVKVKATMTQVFRLKAKCLAYYHPEIELRIV